MTSPSSFDRSALPTARTFYEKELGELRRASRGWARPKGGCPFHESKSKASFAINIDSGGFFCFSCGAHGGDVIEFVRQRYDLSFPDALKHFRIESNYNQSPKKREPPIALERRLARALAIAVEYGKDSSSVR
jgi:DNA primase